MEEQGEEQGPFDNLLQAEQPQQRDRAAYVIVGTVLALGLILLLLILPPISILDDDSEPDLVPGQGVSTVLREELPPPPEGFEAVSGLYDLVAGGGVVRPVRLTLSLSSHVPEGTSLPLFTFKEGTWRQVADGVAVADGSAAQAELVILPDNLAVLRLREEATTTLGLLPAGAALDRRALGSLTALSPGGFSPSLDGGVSGEPLDLAPDLTVPVAPTIRVQRPEEVEALNQILSAPDLLASHAQAVQAFVQEGGYAGIHLDYQIIDPAQGEEFVTFVQVLSGALSSEGRTLTLTLPLPVFQDEVWQTFGFDWEALAPLVDAISLPPEPEPDLYYQRMEEVLGYLVPRVGSGKLLLGVSTVSRERGVDGLESLTLTEALALASTPLVQLQGPLTPGSTVDVVAQNLSEATGGSDLHWDGVARAVSFSYTGPGGLRTVWLNNVFSGAFALDLARRFQLGGVAVQDVSLRAADANLWPAVAQYAESGAVDLVMPNGELLKPLWAATGGTLDRGDGAQVTWEAPAEAGSYALTLTVSDGVLRVGQRVPLLVEAAQGAAPP